MEGCQTLEQRRRWVDKRRSTGRDVTLGAVERFSWGLRHRPTDSCRCQVYRRDGAVD